LTEFEHVHK